MPIDRSWLTSGSIPQLTPGWCVRIGRNTSESILISIGFNLIAAGNEQRHDTSLFFSIELVSTGHPVTSCPIRWPCSPWNAKWLGFIVCKEILRGKLHLFFYFTLFYYRNFCQVLLTLQYYAVNLLVRLCLAVTFFYTFDLYSFVDYIRAFSIINFLSLYL